MNAVLTIVRMPPKASGGVCDPIGASGCGQCAACKRNWRRATAKTMDCDKPYLGLKSFASLFPSPVPVATPWLVNHWPKKRVELRREMLAEATAPETLRRAA